MHLGASASLPAATGIFSRNRVLAEAGVEDLWYQSREKSLEEIAIQWLGDNAIPYKRDQGPER